MFEIAAHQPAFRAPVSLSMSHILWRQITWPQLEHMKFTHSMNFMVT